MGFLFHCLKMLFNHPIEFYSKLKWEIISFILRFKWYKDSDSITELKKNWKKINSELIKNWNCYSYLYEKYNNYLYSLPHYKENKDRENVIWRCWLQWEENAPKLNKSCLQSIKKFAKDKKTIVITKDNLEDYVKFPKYIIEKHKKGIIPYAQFSDLIRLELLIKYWWTWIDSTVLLTWYNKDFFNSDFFVFQTDNNDDSEVASNWFITSNKNNPILKTTRDLLFEYFKDNNYLINYFVFYFFFTMAVKKHPEIWDKMPKYSNVPPRTMQYDLLWKYNKKRFEELKKISSVHKLNFKIDRKKLSWNSLFEYIENMKENAF